jgi:hypothetical protein
MPSAARTLSFDHPLYSNAELIEQRRNILRYARSFPPGPERNQHRQIASSLRALFRDREWLDANVLKDSGGFTDGPIPVPVSFRNESRHAGLGLHGAHRQQKVDSGSYPPAGGADRRRLFRGKRRDCAETLDISRSKQGAESRQAFSDNRRALMIFRC